MKFQLTLLILISFMLVSGQICWQEEGVDIYNSANLNWYRSAIALSDDNFIFVWSDALSGWQQVKAMKIDSEGSFLWDEPVLLSSLHSYSPINFKLIESESGVLIAWFEQEDLMALHCQLLDLNGEKLFGDNGFSLTTSSPVSNFPDFGVIIDNSGGFYVYWSIPIGSADVRILHFNSEGEIANGWEEDGKLVNIGNSSFYKDVYGDNQGGVIITSYSNDDILSMQRVNYAGDLLWGEEPLSYAIPAELDLLDFIVNQDGFSIYFMDNHHLLYNTLDDNGNFLYSENQYLYSYPEFSSNHRIASFDDSYFFIWLENGMLKAQKYNLEQGNIWDDNGIMLINYLYEINYSIIKNDYNGGFFISLGDYYYDETGIRCQHIDANGNILLGDNGYFIDSLINTRYGETISVSQSGICGFFWKEISDAVNKIMVQMISSESGILLEEDGLDLRTYPDNHIDFCKFTASEDNSFALWQSISERYVIYAQILENAEGERLFPESPIKVIGNEESNFSVSAIEYDTQAEILYFVFNFSINGNDDNDNIGLQAIDLEGNRLFGNEGILIFPEGEGKMSYKTLFQKREDDYLLLINIRNPQNSDENLWELQRLNEDGFLWDEPVFLCTSGLNFRSVNWENDYLSWAEDNLIKVLKFDEYGNIDPSWINEPLVLETPYDVKNLKTEVNVNDELTILWNNSETYNIQHVMGQKLDSNGNLLWGESGICYFDVNGSISDIISQPEHFYTIEFNEVSQKYYLMKFTYSGDMLWQNAVEILDNQFDCLLETQIYQDQIMVFYQPVDDDEILKMKMYSADGEMLPQNNPLEITICSEDGDKELISASILDNSTCIVSWLDERDYLPYPLSYNPGCYAQKIDLRTLENFDDEISKPVEISNYPNPFSWNTQFKIPASIERNTAVLSIYNIKGQLVESIDLSRNEPVWTPQKNNKDICSSIYLYEIKSKNKHFTGRMLYLKSD